MSWPRRRAPRRAGPLPLLEARRVFARDAPPPPSPHSLTEWERRCALSLRRAQRRRAS